MRRSPWVVPRRLLRGAVSPCHVRILAVHPAGRRKPLRRLGFDGIATICAAQPSPCVLLTASLLLAGCASMSDLGGILGGSAPLDEATVAAGLKEALSVGTERTVTRTSRIDGYLGDALLRIVLPEQIQEISPTLRSLGLGGKLDQLEVAMNRAAELAAKEATGLFIETIGGMTLQDAWGILRGHDTAATDYFRERTTAALTSRYRPIVQASLRQVGGYAEFEDLSRSVAALPLVTMPDLDLVGYVTDRALAGLFTVLGQEEQRIRVDPLARTTVLLQRVFAAR
jgi:hypothetical protein